MNTTTNTTETLTAAIASLGLTYTATFVPFSRSRNTKTVKKLSDLSLNWRIALSKGMRKLETDYMQGIAHIPGYRQTFGHNGLSVNEESAIRTTCETGKGLASPLLRDVLYSLLLDSDVIEYSSFEEWANEFGYDPDSRAGEKIYKQCLAIALELRAMIGQDGIDTLRQAFQESEY